MKTEAVAESFAEITSDSKFYCTKGPGSPRLLVMSGLPMSGKSHLSNMISERMDRRICVVRTDSFRPTVARKMGRSQPVYDKKEHSLVFELGNRLVSKALENGWSVIADATNLTDRFREWAVGAAVEKGIQTLVAFVEICPETAMERAREKDRSGSAATPAVYALLSYEKEPVEMCTSPYIIINSETDVRPWADTLSRWLGGTVREVEGTVFPSTGSR